MRGKKTGLYHNSFFVNSKSVALNIGFDKLGKCGVLHVYIIRPLPSVFTYIMSYYN